MQSIENFFVEILWGYSSYAAFLAVILMIFVKPWNKADLIIRIITTFLLVFIADQSTWWTFLSVYFRIVLWVLFIISVVVSFKRFRKLPGNFHGVKVRIIAATCICLSIVFIYFGISIIRGHFYTETPVELGFPFKNGIFTFPNAGNGDYPILNYHYKMGFYVPPPGNGITAKYAMDFRKISRWGNEKKRLTLSKDLNEYLLFNEPIYSPCDGEVIFIIDGQPDRMTSVRGGNIIVIKCSDQKKLSFPVVVMLAHLEQGSIKVKVFDKVKKGQMIARAGASGTPSPKNPPSLHMQANEYSSSGAYGIFGKSLPITFDGHFPTRNDIVIK
ncbi:MAG: peptidoglycan DD-metalloendopeptidase family protein [Bacillota bacterium]|nr:peptidoglycan DD-metalloendopeptidase family protein [Bacillota bacterium]